jgi:hypothetical protein
MMKSTIKYSFLLGSLSGLALMMGCVAPVDAIEDEELEDTVSDVQQPCEEEVVEEPEVEVEVEPEVEVVPEVQVVPEVVGVPVVAGGGGCGVVGGCGPTVTVVTTTTTFPPVCFGGFGGCGGLVSPFGLFGWP